MTPAEAEAKALRVGLELLREQSRDGVRVMLEVEDVLRAADCARTLAEGREQDERAAVVAWLEALAGREERRPTWQLPYDALGDVADEIARGEHRR